MQDAAQAQLTDWMIELVLKSRIHIGAEGDGCKSGRATELCPRLTPLCRGYRTLSANKRGWLRKEGNQHMTFEERWLGIGTKNFLQ